MQGWAHDVANHDAPSPPPDLLSFAAGDPRRIVDIADQSRCKDERYIREEKLPKRLPRNDLVLPETQDEYESHNDRGGDTDRSQDRDNTRNHGFCSSIYINLRGRRHLVQHKRLNWLIRGLKNGLTEPPAPQPNVRGVSAVTIAMMDAALSVPVQGTREGYIGRLLAAALAATEGSADA